MEMVTPNVRASARNASAKPATAYFEAQYAV
jgi:hypothetical protein